MSTVPEMFASKVFDDKVMRARLPEKVYQSLHRTIASGAKLNPDLANAVADAMVDWAVETGQSIIQLLPINDTTMTRSWTDSYPYNANSTFALHPQFISLPEAGVKVTKEYKALQKELV